MLNISPGKFTWTFLVGFLICSNLNWAIAEFFLFDWAAPRLDGFYREGSIAASGANITKMTIGFMIPLFVSVWWFSSTDKPAGWLRRAIYTSTLVSIAAFFGTYTFISGWGNVNWWPLMVTALCDMASIVPGTILIGWLQQLGSN